MKLITLALTFHIFILNKVFKVNLFDPLLIFLVNTFKINSRRATVIIELDLDKRLNFPISVLPNSGK